MTDLEKAREFVKKLNDIDRLLYLCLLIDKATATDIVTALTSSTPEKLWEVNNTINELLEETQGN